MLREMLGWAYEPGLVLLDLAPFFAVPANPSRSCLQAVCSVAGKAVLGMGWYPGGQAGLVVLTGQSPHFSSISPLIPLTVSLSFSLCPTEVGINLCFCPSANRLLCPG